MLKLSKLFFISDDSIKVFSDRINPTTDQKEFLNNCRREIVNYLEAEIAKATVTKLGLKKQVTPKFRTQGSWAYGTCVVPAHEKQEMDWDLGVYLPIDVWEASGPPKEMAKKYFELVEDLLKPFCKKKGWNLVLGSVRKQTCIRINVSSWAHMDLPLYAAPAHEFDKISERITAAFDSASSQITKREFMENADILDSLEFDAYNQAWEDMEEIMMATRSGEWRASDPEAVRRWFVDRLRECENRSQLVRVCKYLKAWRDFTWEDGGGPSSVAIMVAIARDFEPVDRRDDIALIGAAKLLSEKLMGDILVPEICDEPFNRLDAAQRIEASSNALYLSTEIKNALGIEVPLRHLAYGKLLKLLGSRIPNNINLIEVESSANIVRNTPAIPQVKPVAGSSKSG